MARDTVFFPARPSFKSLILIDDDPATVAALTSAFQDDDVAVHSLNDTKKAVQLALAQQASKSLDASVLINLDAAHFNGAEVVCELRDRGFSNTILGLTRTLPVADLPDSPVNGYLKKPVDAKSLRLLTLTPANPTE